MNLNSLLVTDTSGKKSLTATAFIVGFVVVNLKLLSSGMVFGKVTLQPFTGVEYAAAMTALGALYVLRRSTDTSSDKKGDAPDGK